jgi:hypothetical protein
VTITATVVIKRTEPHGPAGIFGATKTEVVLQFDVNVSTLAEVHERVASLLRAGLAPDASERAFDAAYTMPPTVDADLLTGAEIAEQINTAVPDGRGKHSGACRCSACAEPDAPDDTPDPIRIPDTTG